MSASEPSPPQNQLAFRFMREREAIEMQAAPFDATSSALQGFGGHLTTLAAVLAAAGVVFAVVVSGTGQPLLMTLIAMLAIVGLFFLFAIGAGYICLTERQPLAELVKTVTDGLDTGVMIARRDGSAIYANATLETIVGHSDIEGLSSLEELFTGETQAKSAFYRLIRAAERGELLSEEFRLKCSATGIRLIPLMNIWSRS